MTEEKAKKSRDLDRHCGAVERKRNVVMEKLNLRKGCRNMPSQKE